MSFSCRFLRRSVFPLLGMLSAVCAAQVQQFLKVPEVQPTEGQVRSFVTGQFQQPPNQTDILYVNAPAVGGTKSTIVAGALLYSQGFSHIGQNQIAFQDVTSVVATPGDFNGDGLADFAFALTPTSASGPQLCVYYGSGATVLQGASGMSAYNGGNAYPPVGQNGCLSIAIPGNPPNLDYITTIPGRPGFPPELAFEDTANNYLFVYANTGVAGTGGVLTGFTQMPTVLLPAVDGSGPIYTGDLNGDGVADFVINGQTGHSASVYLGKADGTFQFSHRYVFDKNVHSMLLQDMDGDNRLDIVVEGDNGVIEIFKGNGDGTFATTSEGGTAAGVDGYSGQGGHLAAINPISHDILVTMPIGLSVLQGNGTLSYALKTIYNIGPGRASYALADFFGTNNLDFAVDSPEGIAIIPGNPDGTFQSSNAYASLSPALGAVVGKFRNAANNPAGNLDVAVATSADYAQLLTGHGDGTFSPATTPTGYPGANSPWSTIFAGDFNGDTKLDLAYSWRGLPVPAANPASSGIAVQYGNGDGTFGVANYSFNQSLASVDYLNGESAVGDFNGDNIDDLANLDPLYDTTLLGSASGVNGGSFNIGLQAQDNKNVVFNQVATGFFKTGRTNKQDLVFQEGANFVPYVNSGDGKNFAQKTALTGAAPPLYPSAVLLNDVDGDGNGDLVVVYYNTASNPAGAGPVSPYQAYVWWGNGDGTFAAPTVLNLSRNYYLGAVADMNGDGRPDLILSDSSLVSILYNQGSRSFGTVLANGELSSEQHFLAGQGINSLSVADVNGDGEPDLIVANGGVTISNPIALGGETAPSLSLTPNPDVNTGGVTVILSSISTSPITGTLAALPEPSTFGAMFTLAATLTPSPSVAAPTGTVQFSIDGIPVGNPVPVVPGSGTSTATYAVPAGNTYVGGQHTLGASYNGDARNSPLTFNGTHVVQDDTTSTVLALCVGPSPTCPSNGLVSPPYTPSLPMVYGQTYNGIASVTASDGGPVPGNTLILDAYNGGAPVVICTLLTQAGGACPSSVGIGTQVGVHVLTAQYVPGANDTHTGSTSAPVTITVTQDTIGASLAGLPNPASVGQPVALTVTLTGGNAPPGGPQASLGTYGPPTGQVVFNYGSAVLGIGTLATNSGNVSSSATITTSLLPLGADTITATYAGNLDFAPTTATAVETITPSLAGSFALAVTPTPITVGVGYAALFKVTVTSLNGFAQTVNLSCANLPTEATCHFDSTQIAAGNGVTQMIVFTSAPHSCGSTQPYFLGSNGAAPFALPTLACFAVLFVPGRRRWLRALVALAICVVAVQITGCGNCTDLGTRPGTYTFQVSGTSSSTSEVKSQPVTITVAI